MYENILNPLGQKSKICEIHEFLNLKDIRVLEIWIFYVLLFLPFNEELRKRIAKIRYWFHLLPLLKRNG